MNDRREWLDGLQIGDTVAVKRLGLRDIGYVITEVKTISPGREAFGLKGLFYEFSGCGYRGSLTMEPVTPQVLAANRREQAPVRVRSVKHWERFSTEHLERIAEIIQEPREEDANDSQ